MKRCTRCVMPEAYPGIQFDEHGLCHYCRKWPTADRLDERKKRLRQRFDALVDQLGDRPGYHCMVSLSGGKDSTYTLWLLTQQYGLRTLAFTLDNCFIAPDTLKNMRLVAEHLGSDHVIVKPRFDVLRKVFLASMQPGMHPPKALSRASSICNSCISVTKGIGMRMAIERGIPMLVYGWAPGQIPLTSALYHPTRQMLKTMISAAKAPLEVAAGQDIAIYFPDERHLENSHDIPTIASPLVFLEYDESKILKQIDLLAWVAPENTDPTSTNCLLNGLANQHHLEQTGYHPYVMDLSGLVREGYISRQEALERLRVTGRPEVIAAVEAKLGVPTTDRHYR